MKEGNLTMKMLDGKEVLEMKDYESGIPPLLLSYPNQSSLYNIFRLMKLTKDPSIRS